MLYKYEFESGKGRKGVIFCNWTMSEQLKIAFEQAMIADINRLGLILEKPVKVEETEVIEENRYIQILKESIERVYASIQHQSFNMRIRAFNNQINPLKEEL